MKALIKSLWLVSALICFSGCGSGGSSGTLSGTPKILTGKAALGAFFPNGSPVEIRGSAGTQPSAVLTTTVQDDSGDYSIDVSSLTAPYLIRVDDTTSNTWYYSYSDGVSLVANANPYTDMLVRAWYLNASQIGGNPAHIDIDSVFTSGVYPPGTANVVTLDPPSSSGTLPDNTPINLPDPAKMAIADNTLAATVSRAYDIDLEDVLTSNWVPGVGFDALLASVGVANLQTVINSSLNASYFAPNYVESALLYIEVVMAQTGNSPGTQSVQLVADVYTAGSSLEVTDARQGYGQTIPLTEDTSGQYNRFYGSLTLTGTPALYYQFTVNGDVYSTVEVFATHYGVMTLNPDGSVASFTPGVGATINSTTSGSVQYSVPDMTPIDVQITAPGSEIVLFEKTYARGATWSGSDTLAYDSAGAAFDLHLVGSNGERTVVQYSP